MGLEPTTFCLGNQTTARRVAPRDAAHAAYAKYSGESAPRRAACGPLSRLSREQTVNNIRAR